MWSSKPDVTLFLREESFGKVSQTIRVIWDQSTSYTYNIQFWAHYPSVKGQKVVLIGVLWTRVVAWICSFGYQSGLLHYGLSAAEQRLSPIKERLRPINSTHKWRAEAYNREEYLTKPVP